MDRKFKNILGIKKDLCGIIKGYWTEIQGKLCGCFDLPLFVYETFNKSPMIYGH